MSGEIKLKIKILYQKNDSEIYVSIPGRHVHKSSNKCAKNREMESDYN